jgi:hypothetical protein
MQAIGDTVEHGAEIYTAFWEPINHLTHWLPPGRMEATDPPAKLGDQGI